MICRLCLLVLFAVLGPVPLVRGEDPSLELRVMSFNIRYGTAKDGPNGWDRRREFLAETIRTFHPDLLGTQETLGFQRDFLAKELAGYDVLGVGRNDGKEEGEMMALYYRRDRFEKLDAGHFWLSKTPEQIGSQSWDSSLPRMATWVKLRDRQQPDARPILFLNTHFDHRGKTARAESARLIRRRLEAAQGDTSLVVTGDFNSDEGSEPYLTLFETAGGTASPVVDTFRAAHPQRMSGEGTATGFRAAAIEGARIDWIAASEDWTIRASGIDRTSRDGRTPSDHFPVTAVLSRTP